MINDLIAEPGFFLQNVSFNVTCSFFLGFHRVFIFFVFLSSSSWCSSWCFWATTTQARHQKQGPARNDAKKDGLSRLEVSTFRAISSDFSEFEFVEPPTLNLQIHVLVSLQLHICQFLGGSACANNSFIQQSKANKFKFCNFVELPMFWDC